MNSYLNRIHHFKGNPYEIGFTAGHTFANKLELTINHYIANVENTKDLQKLYVGALPWLRTLPKRFQEEFEGMAEGSNIPLQRLAEWASLRNAMQNNVAEQFIYPGIRRGWRGTMISMCLNSGGM